jgi:hypothetical protein
MVLSIIFLEDKHTILLYLSTIFSTRICFSIQPADYSDPLYTLTPHGKKMHVKEIYVIFIHLFYSGILLIIDLNKKKGKGGGFYL